MKNNKIFEAFINVLLEKGGKKSKNKIKFYTPELNLEDKETKRKYEISSIDTSDPNNPIFELESYDIDGNKIVLQKSAEEIIKNYTYA